MVAAQALSQGILQIKDGKKTLYVSHLRKNVFRLSSTLEKDPEAFSPIGERPADGVAPEVKAVAAGLTLVYPEVVFQVGKDLLLEAKTPAGELLFKEIPFADVAEAKKHDWALHGEDYAFLKAFQLQEGEHFYGLGDNPKPLDHRNYRCVNWNTDYVYPHCETVPSLYKSFPFYIRQKGKALYGLFLDNPRQSLFDFGLDTARYYFGALGGKCDAYLFLGTMADIVSELTALCGRCPLPPRWSLGYGQCRWSYPDEKTARGIVAKFKEHDLPLDALYLDIDYMEGYRIFTVNKKAFPDLKKMSDDFLKDGIHLVTIIDPGLKVDPAYPVYEEAIKNHYVATLHGETYVNQVWPGDAVYPAFNDAKVRAWWGEECALLLNQGVAGLWCDMNEPASFKGPLPLDVSFAGQPHSLIHNVYGYFMSEATAEGIKKQTGKRPFVITRACYEGSQKFTSVWTGDNQSIYDSLRLAIPQQLSLGLSGMAFVGTDIGGFSGDCTPELLRKWIRLGIYSPLFRNHCTFYNRPQKP